MGNRYLGSESQQLSLKLNDSHRYGLNINTIKTKRRVFVNSVADNSEAQRVGLKKGDCLLQINGEAVEKLNFDRLEGLLNSDVLELLVVSDLHGHLSKGALNPFKSDESVNDPVVPIFDDLFLQQQAVMASLVSAIESNGEFRNKLKTLELQKNEPFVGFGLSIHTEPTAPCQANHKLVYPLVEIEDDSPAQAGGLEFGHRIVAVDGQFINRELRTLNDVSSAIDDGYYQDGRVQLTVMEPVMWEDFLNEPKKAADLILPNARINSAIRNNVLRRDALPRICRLERKDAASFGFSILTIRNDVKNIALVLPDFPAEMNGMSFGDQILEVNGTEVASPEEFLNAVYSDKAKVDLLVRSDKLASDNDICIDF